MVIIKTSAIHKELNRLKLSEAGYAIWYNELDDRYLESKLLRDSNGRVFLYIIEYIKLTEKVFIYRLMTKS